MIGGTVRAMIQITVPVIAPTQIPRNVFPVVTPAMQVATPPAIAMITAIWLATLRASVVTSRSSSLRREWRRTNSGTHPKRFSDTSRDATDDYTNYRLTKIRQDLASSCELCASRGSSEKASQAASNR